MLIILNHKGWWRTCHTSPAQRILGPHHPSQALFVVTNANQQFAISYEAYDASFSHLDFAAKASGDQEFLAFSLMDAFECWSDLDVFRIHLWDHDGLWYVSVTEMELICGLPVIFLICFKESRAAYLSLSLSISKEKNYVHAYTSRLHKKRVYIYVCIYMYIYNYIYTLYRYLCVYKTK